MQNSGVSDGEKRRGEERRRGAVTFRFACAHQEGRFVREERQLAAVGRSAGRSGCGLPSFPSGENFPLSEWTETWPEAEVAEGTNERRDGKVKREREREEEHNTARRRIRSDGCNFPTSLRPPPLHAVSLPRSLPSASPCPFTPSLPARP